MLKRVLSNDKSAHTLLILDTVDISDDRLFIALLNSHAQSSVSCLCVDNHPSSYQDFVQNDNIQYHDFYSDPLHWLNSNKCNISKTPFDSCFRDENISEKVVFIDSISQLILYNRLEQFTRDLNQLMKKAKRVVIRLHTDALNEINDVPKLKYLATTVVEIKRRIDGRTSALEFLASVLNRKPDGKFESKQDELISISSDFVLSSSYYNESPAAQKQPQTLDMSSITSFDLGLNMSLSEKKARDELILPYTRSKETGGMILYEADDADLEEDPDDDLEL